MEEGKKENKKSSDKKEADSTKVENNKPSSTKVENNLDKEVFSPKQDKQIYYALWIMAGLIFLVLIFHFILNESGKFTYSGVEFEKINYDKLPLYKSLLNIKNIFL